jgi:hypothetical protein
VEVRVFFWAPIQIQGYGLEFHKNPRKRVFAFLAFENTPLPPTCRSELARDEFTGDAFIQPARVIVQFHREQARSYKSNSGAFEKQYRLSLLQVFAMRQ